jgi:hypothetical protein
MTAASTFCPNCGASIGKTIERSAGASPPKTMVRDRGFDARQPADEPGYPPVEEAGFVSNGQWYRPPGEFIRRVRQGDMETTLLGGRSVQVPRGTIGVLADGDNIVDVVKAGNDINITGLRRVWDALKRHNPLWGGSKSQTDLYLIDRRPIPIPFSVETSNATGISSKVEVLAEVSVDEHPDALSRLLNSELVQHDALSARNLYDLFAPRVQKTMRQILATYTTGIPADGFAEVGARLSGELEKIVTDPYGLVISVHVTPLAELVAVDVRLGAAPAPAIKQCVGCGQELRSTVKFCAACGTEQPAQQMPSRTCPGCGYSVSAGKKFCPSCGNEFGEQTAEQEALFTKDGQQVELDLLVRVSGVGGNRPDTKERFSAMLASAASGFLRSRDYADICTPDGFRAFETAVQPVVFQAVTALGLTLVDVVILDIRTKQGEWELKARAELEQARKEALIGREWLQVETESLDLKAISLDLVLRQRQIDLDHEFRLDEATLADRERRQQQLDREATMDVADTRREVGTTKAQEEAVRDLDRTRAAEAHADALTGMGREHELTSAQADHEMALESKVADHDAELARKAMALESDKSRLVVDDKIYGRKAERDLDLDTAKQIQEQELEAERRRQGMNLEKLQAMAELEARMTAQDHDHELKMRESLKGQSVEQMLAMQAQGDEAIAAALAERFRAEGAAGVKTETMYERLLADRDQKDAQMAAMMQQMMATMQATAAAAIGGKATADAVAREAVQAKADQAVAMSERVMGAMSNVAAAAAGRSVVMGGQPLAPPPPAPPPAAPQPDSPPPDSRAKAAPAPTCANCDAPLEPPYAFCGACGTRQ